MGPGTCPQLPPTTWLADLSLIVVMIFARPPDLFPDCRLDCGSSAPVGGPVPGLSVLVCRLWGQGRFADLSPDCAQFARGRPGSRTCPLLWFACPSWRTCPWFVGYGFQPRGADTQMTRPQAECAGSPDLSPEGQSCPTTCRGRPGSRTLSLIVALSPKVTRSSLRLRPTGTKVSARRFNPGTSVRI